METNLLDRMLNTYQDGRTPVTVTLQNKIRVSGKIKAFDSYVIVMEGHKREIVYRHAISSLTPQAQEQQKPRPAPARPLPIRTEPPAPSKTASHKPKMTQPPKLTASPSDGINSSMKDGLLKWMLEQKASK